MRNCSVKRNSSKEIVTVLTQNGKESQLFKTIATHTAIADTETALSVYKNIYTDNFKDVSEDEMELSHRVSDVQYTSFKEALKSAKENQNISIGVNVGGKFTELLTIPKNTKLDNEIGFTQNGILNETISENKLKVGNEYKLQTFGKTNARRQASLGILREQSLTSLGSQSIKVDETSFTINKTLNSTLLYDKSGKEVKENISNLSDDEIRSKFQNANELIAEKEYTRNFPLKRGTPLAINNVEIKSNEELVLKLTSLLKKMGISIVSMANYITNYTLRHGVNPNAEALADIANQVIAISTGQESATNLLEETVHFIVEALPQERIENILRNIDKSEEYKQHYLIQKAIYESEYKGEELDNVVRREILGKILVNAISQTEEKSDTQQNFFENAKKLISEFFENIVNYFKPQYQTELDSLINDVQNLIDSQDISGLELGNFENNNSRFYNVSFKDKDNEITKEALKNIGILIKLEKDLNKTGRGNNLNLKELQKAKEDLDSMYSAHAVAKVSLISSNTVNILNEALKDSKDNNRNYDLSQEENVVYNNLTTEVKKGLSVLKEMLDSKAGLSLLEQKISNDLSKTVSEISELEAKKTVDHKASLEKMIRAVTTDRGLPEREFESMMAWTIRAEKDINYMNKTFGTLNNSSDSLANLYATLKTNMTNRASQKSHNETKKFQAELRRLGKDEKYVASLIKDGYFISDRDIPRFLKDKDENFRTAFLKEFPQDKRTTEELLKERKKDNLDLTFEQKERIESEENRLNDSIREKRMLDTYYEELEKKYKDLGTSQETKDLLRALNSEKTKTRGKIRDANGIEDLSKLSLQDRELLKQLDQKRKQLKSPVDIDGTIKTDLTLTKNSEGKTVIGIKNGKTVDDLLSSSRIAYDIFLLDNNGIIEREEADRPTTFDNLILSKGTKEEQVEALNLNANISLSNEFWEKSKSLESLVDRLNSVKTEDNEAEIEILIAELEELNSREKALIKQYVKSNNPSETDVESMGTLTKNALKELAQDAEIAKEKARKLTKDVEATVNEEKDGVSSTNEAWSDVLSDNGFELSESTQGVSNITTALKIVNLAKQHTTAKNSQSISDAESNTRLFREGKTTHISKGIENALVKQGLTKQDLFDDFKYSKFIVKYSEDRLLSYYKRYTSESYIEFQNDLLSDMEMSEILKKDYQYLQITPNYSFNEEDTSKMNPDYIANSKIGFDQPKKSEYENKDFTSKFGKIIRDDKGYLVSSERGGNEFEPYKLVMNFRFKQIDTTDGGASYNAYITPQIRKQTIERWATGLKNLSVQNIKDTFENITTYTEDDMELGDNTFGVNNKIIPRQYINKLENQTDITTDVFNALILSNNASNLYESRVNYFGDFMAIQDVAKNRQTEGAIKETSSTNRFKTIESAIENDLFGIKQVSTDTFMGKDTAKMVDSLGAFTRLKGLGGSVIIPLTAYLTGKTKQTVERSLGQYYNRDSFNRGTKEYSKQLGKALAETSNLQSVAEMNVKGEYWQAFELTNRLYGASFNMFQRYFSKSAMLLYQAANYPIYAKNMYNVLHDFRIVNSKIVKFTDFQRNELNKDYRRTKEQIKADWAKEQEVINSYHTADKNGEVVWDREGLKKIMLDNEGNQYSDEALNQEIFRFSDDIRIQIKNLNVRSDMQLSHEDKVAAQRHYLTNFLMSFKGFMIPLYEERFKNPTDKFNSQSRQMEQGSYVGIYELGKDILKDVRKNGSSFMKAFQKQYNGDFTEQKAKIDELKARTRTEEEDLQLKTLTEDLVRDMEMVDLRHYHLKRLGIDMLFLNGLVAIMLILRSYADDDEDKSNYALQMAALLSQRLAGEVNTANLNLVSNYYDVASNPLQAFRMITDISKLPTAYQKDELLITVGKGYVPFVSSFTQMIDPATTADSARYFSEVKGNAFWSVPLYNIMEE